VFGLRPSFGRVPADNADAFVAQGGVEGPIARTALDLALLLRTMSGYDPRAPLSIEQDPAHLTALDEGGLAGKRVLWMGDLGGYLPMDPEVLEVCRAALASFESLGMSVSISEALPSFGEFRGTADLWPTWLVYRHWLAGASLLPVHADPVLRAELKPEAIYEVDGLLNGLDGSGPLTAAAVHRASVLRTAMYQAFHRLFDEYDFAVLPSAQVFPFDLATHWPASVAGAAMSSYHRWMEVTAVATLINAPALAMPAGFGRAGLPIGLQVITRNHREGALLRLARAWERQTGWVQRVRPALLGS
jgi:amidase